MNHRLRPVAGPSRALRIVIAGFALACVTPALPAAAADSAGPASVQGFSFVKSAGGIEEYQLDSNGLSVLLSPDHSAPVVTFEVTYRVGSRNEVTGTTGATHILEHMMFKGSENFNDPKGNSVKQFLERVGGQFNASTSVDRTNYFATIGRDSLEDISRSRPTACAVCGCTPPPPPLLSPSFSVFPDPRESCIRVFISGVAVCDRSSSHPRTGRILIEALLDQVSSIDNLQSAVGKIRSNPKALGRLIHLDVDSDTFQVICFVFILSSIPHFFPSDLFVGEEHHFWIARVLLSQWQRNWPTSMLPI